MPTETDPITDRWERNAKLCGVPPEELMKFAHEAFVLNYDLMGVQPYPRDGSDSTDWTPELRRFLWDQPGSARIFADYDWVFDAITGKILKTPHNVSLAPADAFEVVAPDDGWSDVAELTGADVEALRGCAMRAPDDGVVTVGNGGMVVSFSSSMRTDAKWVFDAKTARMLKGPVETETQGDDVTTLGERQWGPVAKMTDTDVRSWIEVAGIAEVFAVGVEVKGDAPIVTFIRKTDPETRKTWGDRCIWVFTPDAELVKAPVAIFEAVSERTEADEVKAARALLLRRISEMAKIDPVGVRQLAEAYTYLR